MDFGFVFHVVAFGFYIYTRVHECAIPGITDTYGGSAKYMTNLNVYVSIIYYGYAVLIDIKAILFTQEGTCNDKQPKHNRVRDYLFLSVVFPVSCGVSLFFWGIHNYNPDLLLSPILRKEYMPLHGFYNHAVHTSPVISALLECLIIYHQPPSSFIWSMIGSICYATAYLFWILWIAYYANIWVYPFLTVLSTVNKLYFFLFAYTSMGFLNKVGVSITQLHWNNECNLSKKIS